MATKRRGARPVRCCARATWCASGSIVPEARSAGRERPWRPGNVEILYEDDALMVVNKPPGLLSVPLPRKPDAGSAYDDLEAHLRPRGKRKPLVVHRIDRDTSGLVVFARTSRAQQALKDQFRRREPERVYLAVVYGHPEPREGTWRDFLLWDSKALIQKRTRAGDLAAKEAISRYRVLESLEGASLIEVRLVPASATRSGCRPDCAGTRW